MAQQHHHHTYTVTVKTANSDEFDYVETENKGFILAKENSMFYLELRNNSTVDRCDASVTIGKGYVGTWSIDPGQVVVARSNDSRGMCFNDANFYDVAAYTDHAEVAEESSITVVFLPMCANQQKCAPVDQPDGTTTIVCHSEIQWNKVVKVKIPVLLRKHHNHAM